jgi:hypothetical protein
MADQIRKPASGAHNKQNDVPCPAILAETVSSSDFRPYEGENPNGSSFSTGQAACDHGSTGGGAWQNKSKNPAPADQASRLVIEWTAGL